MIVQLGDVIQKILGNEDRLTTEREFYVGGEHFISGNLEVKQRGIIKNEDLGYQFHFPFECGDVLFMTKNPRLRKAGRADFSGICSIATFVIRTKSELVLSQDFLPVIFQSDDFWDYLIANQSGSVNPFIKWGTLEKYTFNLPDISVQNHYCKIIWDLQELINTLEKHSSLLDQLVKSRFIEMFGRVKTNEKNLQKTTLNQICKSIVDGSHNPAKGGEKSDYLMLSSKNIVDNVITYEDPRYLSKEDFDSENKRTQVKPGDILMTIVGTIGRTAIVPVNAGNITFQRSVAVLHLDESIVNSIFVKYCIDSIQADIDSEAHGSSQKGIYLNQVEKIPVLVPSMSLQREFASFVEQVDKSRFELQRHLENTRKLQKALINQAFKERTHHDT